ncbi:MAG: metal-dependent transcriptional regulator [Melioribacteraceae bacterium]|nr:metal-dependent transcriptional regulator [Melioribacteraceae bacterium]
MEPITAIIIGLMVLAVTAFVIWPQNGLIAIWKRYIWNANKVLIEDALKRLYQLEENKVTAAVQNIEKALTISSSKANELVAQLEKIGLIITINNKIELTTEGRNYSLQVIRNHRLWEKYLADETGTKEIDWHIEAEHAEHTLTPAQADELAAKIGNPLVDPHGDPIPTSSGKMPDRKGIPITELSENDYVEIIHLEDEPTEVYEQLIEVGLYPGMHLRIKSINDKIIQFDADGKDIEVKSEFGQNISVATVDVEHQIDKSIRVLSTLKVGESGKVLGICSAIRGKQRRRLLDFGLVPGTSIAPRLVSFSGDPVAYTIRGTSIALRKQQADMIFIEDDRKEKIENE